MSRDRRPVSAVKIPPITGSKMLSCSSRPKRRVMNERRLSSSTDSGRGGTHGSQAARSSPRQETSGERASGSQRVGPSSVNASGSRTGRPRRTTWVAVCRASISTISSPSPSRRQSARAAGL